MINSTTSSVERTEQALERARGNLTVFKQVLYRRYMRAGHLDLLDRALTQVSRYVETGGAGGIGRLVIEMPPRHGKTVTTSRFYPAWHLGRNPEHRVMLVSYGASLADKNSRAAGVTFKDNMTKDAHIEHKKITDLKPDPANANAGTERGLRALDDSLAEVGLGRSVLVDKNGYLIAGNKTVERSVDRGFEDAIVVHTRGDKLVVVQRDDLDLTSADDFKARKLAYYDNRVGQLDLEWNVDQVLSDLQSGVDLGNLFDVDGILDAISAAEPEFPADADADTPSPINRWDVPDAIFPTDNDFEIPLLDINLQARSLDFPFVVWGTQSLSKPVPKGTLCFYVEDYRFEALWSDPSTIVNTHAAALIEPNFSCYPSMPVAVGAYQIYRKRWIARWCQTHGMKVFVDLNVAPKWREINMMGIPRGWSAYCTRGAHDALDELDEEFALACERAEQDNPLFVVYGGGNATRDICKQRGWLWLDNQKRRLNGTITEVNDGE